MWSFLTTMTLSSEHQAAVHRERDCSNVGLGAMTAVFVYFFVCERLTTVPPSTSRCNNQKKTAVSLLEGLWVRFWLSKVRLYGLNGISIFSTTNMIFCNILIIFPQGLDRDLVALYLIQCIIAVISGESGVLVWCHCAHLTISCSLIVETNLNRKWTLTETWNTMTSLPNHQTALISVKESVQQQSFSFPLKGRLKKIRWNKRTNYVEILSYYIFRYYCRSLFLPIPNLRNLCEMISETGIGLYYIFVYFGDCFCYVMAWMFG